MTHLVDTFLAAWVVGLTYILFRHIRADHEIHVDIRDLFSEIREKLDMIEKLESKNEVE